MATHQLGSHRSALLAERARQMRCAPTRTERIVWQAVSGNKLGVSFKRQVVVGGRYIVDFLAPATRVAVEVDGPYHVQRVQADARRDRALARMGYRVVRIQEELVLRALPVALARIRKGIEHQI